MRLILTLCLTFLASAVSAHPGHIIDVAGHDHWVAGIAIGAAVAIGLWGALRPKKGEVEEAEPEGEMEEEAA